LVPLPRSRGRGGRRGKKKRERERESDRGKAKGIKGKRLWKGIDRKGDKRGEEEQEGK